MNRITKLTQYTFLFILLSFPALASSSQVKPVEAFSVAQDAEGLTESGMTIQWLEAVEKWLVTGTIEQGRIRYIEMGHDSKKFKPNITSESIFVAKLGKKFAVIKMVIMNQTRIATIFGVKEKELLRVNCVRKSNHEILIWSGTCGNEIKKTFNVSLTR